MRIIVRGEEEAVCKSPRPSESVTVNVTQSKTRNIVFVQHTPAPLQICASGPSLMTRICRSSLNKLWTSSPKHGINVFLNNGYLKPGSGVSGKLDILYTLMMSNIFAMFVLQNRMLTFAN